MTGCLILLVLGDHLHRPLCQLHQCRADTWYPTWASAGASYSVWTDGWIEGYFCNSNLAQESTCQAEMEVYEVDISGREMNN